MPLLLAEARARADDLDAVSYAVELDLTEADRFRSRVTVRFTSRSGATFLELAGARDLVVEVDGVPVDRPRYDGGRLALDGVRGTHEVTVAATLPYVTDGEGMHTFTDPVDGERYVGAYLGVDLAQRVFACFDQPDVKAPVTLTVDADPGWTVLANGRLESTDQGRRRFATTPPIPVNQVVVCAGPWASRTWSHDGRTFGWHARRSLTPALDRDLDDLRAVTTACFAWYRRAFTPPYAFGDYHQIFVPGQNWGAQETPGCVMYRDELLPESTDGAQRQLRASIIAHEMAHMWFGNLATMRWYEDIWLNESFADFLGFRVAAEAAGYPGALVDVLAWRIPTGFVADGRSSTHPVAARADDVPDSAEAANNFDSISYAKGNALLRQLALWLGDQAFFAGVNRYLERYAFGNADLADFVACLDEAAPQRDVQGWARSWLRTTGYDTIEVADGAAGPELRQHGTRTHRLSVLAYDAELTPVQVRDVELGADPVALDGWHDHVVLPNPAGETYARVALRPRDAEVLRNGVGRVADPLQRAQIWSGLFLELHRRALAPGDVFAAVATQLAGEREAPIVRSVVGRVLRRGLQVCTSADQVRTGFAAVAAACRAGVAACRAGADDALLSAFVDGAVRTVDDPALLLRWHEQGRVEAWPLTAEQRWTLIWRLAELGAADAGLLATSPRDPAEIGDRAARAGASRPQVDAQRAAWSAVRGGQLSNRRLVAVLEGLWTPGRGSLPDEQVAAYLAEAPELAERHGPGFAALLGAAHPGLALAPGRLRSLAGALAGDLPPRLRRPWQDWHDDLTLGVPAG